MAFYNQSLLAVQEGRRRLTELGVPTRRPPDFFCEHAKSDTHMGRVSIYLNKQGCLHIYILYFILEYSNYNIYF